MILKEFKERIDKLIEEEHNGYITFEKCVRECNEVVSDFKYFFTDDHSNKWDIVNQLRMYMLNQLMGLLISLNYED